MTSRENQRLGGGGGGGTISSLVYRLLLRPPRRLVKISLNVVFFLGFASPSVINTKPLL